MKQMGIKELVDAVIAALKRYGYKKSTIHNYERVYTDLIRFANEEKEIKYSIEFSEKYLSEERGINQLHVTFGSDSSFNRQNYYPIRACQCLTEWQLHECIPLKKQGKLASQMLPSQFKPCYESYVALCREAGYSERGIYTRLNRIKRMLLFFNDKGVQDINNLTAEHISAFIKTEIEIPSGTT
jgi:hypothetical protein